MADGYSRSVRLETGPVGWLWPAERVAFGRDPPRESGIGPLTEVVGSLQAGLTLAWPGSGRHHPRRIRDLIAALA